jgi:hypothetical protein
MVAWFTFKNQFSILGLRKLFKIAQNMRFSTLFADHPPRSISPEPSLSRFLRFRAKARIEGDYF